MKTTSAFTEALWVAALVAGLSPAIQAGEARLANSNFDEAAIGWSWETWSQAGSSATYDATVNAAGGAQTSGSMKLLCNFANSPGTYQQAVFTLQLPGEANFTAENSHISFDVKVDINSAFRSEGDFGFLEVILRNGNGWDWTVLPGVRLLDNEWRRVTIPVQGAADSVRAITLKLGENALLGPVTLNIDNIALTTTPDDVIIANGNNGVDDGGFAAPEGWSWETWSQAGSTVTFSPLDFYGRQTSGSIRLFNNFNNAPGSYQQAVYTFVLPAQVDASTEYSHINLDVKVDPSSTPRAAGDYGYFEMILRNGSGWDWISTGPLDPPATGTRLSSTEWTHISMPIRGGDQVHRLTLKLGENALLGPVTLNVDNITWTRNTAPPPPPSVSISPVVTGLNLVHTSSDQYGRHNIRNLSDELTTESHAFINKTEPMTYSFDLLSFPQNPPHAGFQAHLFLVPGAAAASADAGPDWSAPTLIFLDIKADEGGGGNATFRWKTNAPGFNLADVNGHGIYVAGLSNLVSSSVRGKWSVKVTDKTNFTVTAPDGASMTVPLSAETVQTFWTDESLSLANLGVYVGVQGNASQNIGQGVRLGSVSILEGATPILEDTFLGQTELDLTKWQVSGPAAGVQFITPENSGYHLTWSLPDTGFTGWQWTSTLNNPTWTDLPAFLNTPIQLGPSRRQVRVNSSELPAIPAGAHEFYLRMVNPTRTE